MMSKIPEMGKLKERIRLINEKQSYSFNDLNKIVDAFIDTFDSAIKKNAIYPYKNEANALLRFLEIIRRRTYESKMPIKELGGKSILRDEIILKGKCSFSILGYRFNIIYFKEDIDNAVEDINKNVQRLYDRKFLFNSLENCVLKHIELEHINNGIFSDEDIFLGQGKVIMPAKIYSIKYLLFDVFLKGKELEFSHKDEFGTLEEAIMNTDTNILGTVVIAKNTEKYPFFETSFPAVVRKYKEKLHIDN